MADRALFKKGDVVLYELTKGSNEYAKASIVSVHLDDDPPYYTIKYTAFEPDTTACCTQAPTKPKAARSSLSGSGAVVDNVVDNVVEEQQSNPKPVLKPVRHEKQTIQARLKPVPES
mmetsp:Transcript_25252/g.47455  ORF Transcript_25252/g.47455 Transcript_25252/m.47455 type:complete len:117 (-) Transcript_25252:22-372(-)